MLLFGAGAGGRPLSAFSLPRQLGLVAGEFAAAVIACPVSGERPVRLDSAGDGRSATPRALLDAAGSVGSALEAPGDLVVRDLEGKAHGVAASRNTRATGLRSRGCIHVPVAVKRPCRRSRKGGDRQCCDSDRERSAYPSHNVVPRLGGRFAQRADPHAIPQPHVGALRAALPAPRLDLLARGRVLAVGSKSRDAPRSLTGIRAPFTRLARIYGDAGCELLQREGRAMFPTGEARPH